MMEYLSAQGVTQTTVSRPSWSWYRAVTLTERVASQSVTAAVHVSGEQREKAEKTLQQWKTQKPFDTGSFFADRLAMDSLTEQDALALLAEPPEALQQRLGQSDATSWFADLSHALCTDFVPLPLPEQDWERFSRRFAMVLPFYPLLQKSVKQVEKGIAALAQQYNPLPFDAETLLSHLLPNLFQQIEPQISKTLVLELNVARLRGELCGETAQARFQDYLRQLSQRERLQSLLEEYPVLARQVLICGAHWASCSLEFVQRLCADWPEILSMFHLEQESDVLVQVMGGAGDTHRGGHSVMILTFRSGWQLLYKPKSLTIDTHFQGVLAWLNARGADPAFRLLKLIDRGTYGWCEFVAASSCSQREEVARFYERQGGYLALLYALDAIDFHHGNVIAAGEHPLLIDLEALFHPRVSTLETSGRLADNLLQRSVLHIGLLPWRIAVNDEDEGVDISGLAQIEGQMSALPIPQWEEVGTDEMRLVRKRVTLQESLNSPGLAGQKVQALDYLEQITNGFTKIYRLLCRHRGELLMTWLPRFACNEVRFVARTTRSYTGLLNESFHPNLLRDALKRERFLDHLWLSVVSQPALARLIAAERADLFSGDVPLFTTRPQSRGLWTSRGEYLPDFFAESSLEVVSKRIQRLNDEDLQRQTWLIRASFMPLVGEPAGADGAIGDLPCQLRTSRETCVDRERLLAEARAVGDRLCANALRDGDSADWLGPVLLRERDWCMAPAALDLSSGLPGIILFLSYLGSLTGETRYTTLARAGLQTLMTTTRRGQGQELFEQTAPGAFNGLGSRLYLFTHLALLWQDPSLLREASDLAHAMVNYIEKDEKFHLMDGVAGAIACLLNLYGLAPSEQILQIARQCGEHLLAQAQPMQAGLGWRAQGQDKPLSGFSRGGAGIVWSLLRLASVSGEQRFRDTALAALDYERSLFSADQGNWLDLRRRVGKTVSGQATPEQTYGLSWSHGAPGIALGRLISLPYLDDATVRAEIDIALATTAHGFSSSKPVPNHSLAHGDCGNLEAILLATQVLHTSQFHDRLQHLSIQLLGSVQQHGWRMGTPLNVETPGLMFGLAGIGYQCLRLAEPERVPSVLALSPPFVCQIPAQ